MPVPLLPFSDAELFNSVNLALPAWLLLLVAPRWRYTAPFVTATALGFAALYIATIVPQLASGGLDFSDLFSYEGVVKAFATRSTVLPAWLHFVAFDLWTARWEVRNSNTCAACPVVSVVAPPIPPVRQARGSLPSDTSAPSCRWRTPTSTASLSL
jgi:hypothetical protein